MMPASVEDRILYASLSSRADGTDVTDLRNPALPEPAVSKIRLETGNAVGVHLHYPSHFTKQKMNSRKLVIVGCLMRIIIHKNRFSRK